MLNNKERAWIRKHKDFIYQLAEFEDKNPGTVALFHKIIKYKIAQKAEAGRLTTGPG